MKRIIIHSPLQIFAAGDNVNYTGGSDPANAGTYNVNEDTANSSGNLSAEMKTFYDRALLALAGPKLVHDQFGVKKPIPQHGGKTIEFRQFTKLPKALKPITEGVTPTGETLEVGTITATVEQYGSYIETTDMLEMTAIDNIIKEAVEELSDQAAVTLDTVTRNELNAGTNVIYAPDTSSGSEKEITSRADINENCKLTVNLVFKAATALKNMNTPKLSDGSYVAIIHPSVAYDLMLGSGNEWIDIQKYSNVTNIFNGEIGKIAGVRFVESTEAKIFGGEGKDGSAVFSTLFMGKNAYAITEITGGGLETIIKGRGQVPGDYLNQRSSIGWKATKVAKLLHNEYLLRVESGSSFSATAEGN
ncbi:MAG: N4-gp56 family major capsid protein [Oscillospiraceae bacterium]|nr:N4-gp56 family major capsid protein [Oscillospiraceae bacterium]